MEAASDKADKEIAIYALNVALAVELKLEDYDEVHISEIQTMVENELMQGPYKSLARAYIEYRHDRDIAREKQSALTREIEGLIEESNVDLCPGLCHLRARVGWSIVIVRGGNQALRADPVGPARGLDGWCGGTWQGHRLRARGPAGRRSDAQGRGG